MAYLNFNFILEFLRHFASGYFYVFFSRKCSYFEVVHKNMLNFCFMYSSSLIFFFLISKCTMYMSKFCTLYNNCLLVQLICRQALRCKLGAVKPCSPGWDESSIDAFTKLTSAGEFIAEVLGIDRGRGSQGGQYYQVCYFGRLAQSFRNKI